MFAEGEEAGKVAEGEKNRCVTEGKRCEGLESQDSSRGGSAEYARVAGKTTGNDVVILGD